MSKVKSAKELADNIVENYSGTYKLGNDIESLIQSDRRAIIEKCKELIMIDSEPHTMIRCAYACSLLDSVISEIEKEE